MDTKQAGPPPRRVQTIAVKLEILRTECLSQAAQARRWGRPEDVVEWTELAARVPVLATADETAADALDRQEIAHESP